MKPSHLVTPRALSECAFYPSADPIERPTENRASDRAMWIAITGCLIVVALVLVTEAI